MRSRRSLLVPSLALFLCAATGSADVYRFRTIVLTGDPVPGVPGAHFTWLGTAPMGPDDPAPLVDAQGNVSFAGGWMNQVTPHGLFVSRQGTLEPVVLTGEPAIGTGSTFAFLPGIIPGPARISGEQTSFDGGFMPPGESFTEHGVWADRTGTRELIFRQNDHPPGAPPGAAFFQWFHTLVGDGDLVVNARYRVGSSSGINDHGFWRDEAGTLEVVALARTQAPGVPAGVQFGNGTRLSLGAFQEWDLGVDGRITFNAMLMNGGATDLDDEGIWSEGAAGLALLAREGGFAPGMGHPNARLLGNSGFRTFGHDDVIDVLRNDDGDVAFGARVEVPGFDNKANAVYAVRGAGLERITFGMPSGSHTVGAPAPGYPTGMHFKRFPLGAQMNPAGELTFAATVGTAAGSILDEQLGLFVERGGSIQLVARSGDPAAGQLPGVSYTQLFPVAFLSAGYVVFSSGLSTGGRGLFVANPDGSVDHVLSTGSSIAVAPGDQRTVGSFTASTRRTGERLFPISVNFQDGTDGVLVATPETPLTVGPRDGEPSLRLAVVGANPFALETAVSFDLTAPASVSVVIRDLSGREVVALVQGRREPGRHVVRWDGTDVAGRRVAGGMYFVTLETGGRRSIAKLIAMR